MVTFFDFLHTLYKLGLAKECDVPDIVYLPVWWYKEIIEEAYNTTSFCYSSIGRSGFTKFTYESIIFGSIELRPQQPLDY